MTTDGNYNISSLTDGDNEITMIEITQAQYDQYAEEATELNMDIHEYIQLAMEHEQTAEDMNIVPEFDEE